MQTLLKNQIHKHYNVSMLFDKRITFPVIPFFVLLGHWNGRVTEKNRTFRENRNTRRNFIISSKEIKEKTIKHFRFSSCTVISQNYFTLRRT